MSSVGIIIFYSILGAIGAVAIGLLIWMLWFLHNN